MELAGWEGVGGGKAAFIALIAASHTLRCGLPKPTLLPLFPLTSHVLPHTACLYRRTCPLEYMDDPQLPPLPLLSIDIAVLPHVLPACAAGPAPWSTWTTLALGSWCWWAALLSACQVGAQLAAAERLHCCVVVCGVLMGTSQQVG